MLDTAQLCFFASSVRSLHTSLNSLPKNTIFGLNKIENIMQTTKQCWSNDVFEIVEKEKNLILVTNMFSFSHNVSKRLFLRIVES